MSIGAGVSTGPYPPLYAEIPMTCVATGVPLQLQLKNLGIVKLNFNGGMVVRVEAFLPPNLSLGGLLGGVHLRVLNFEVSADNPVLGKVTMTQPNIDTTPLSLLELISLNPPTFRQTLFLDFTVTIEKLSASDPPLVLSNTQTAVLLNDNLTQFPPVGAVYQLQQPIDLAPVGNPSQVVGQLQQFPVTVTHSP